MKRVIEAWHSTPNNYGEEIHDGLYIVNIPDNYRTRYKKALNTVGQFIDEGPFKDVDDVKEWVECMGDDIKGLSKKFLENNFGLIPSICKTYKRRSLEQFVAFMSKCEPDNGWSCEKISVDVEFDVDCIENDNDW